MDEDRLETITNNPWWDNVDGPFRVWDGPAGCKADGGGCTRHHGLVGRMIIWRAVHNKDIAAIKKAVEDGEDVNEVEGAGNTPIHAAAYEGWLEGIELLVSLGAKLNASNNAGDRAYHIASYMDHTHVMDWLEQNGGSKEHGEVLVQDHIPKVQDFFQKECWAHHPKPYQDYIDNIREKDRKTKEHFRNNPDMYP